MSEYQINRAEQRELRRIARETGYDYRELVEAIRVLRTPKRRMIDAHAEALALMAATPKR